MSVTRVRESHDGREGEIDADSATLRRVFWVETDNPRDGSLIARDAPGVPALYSPYFDGYTVNLNYVVKRKTAANHQDSQTLWRVEVEYEQKLDPNDNEQNPVNKPATYAWSDFSTAVEMLVDTTERICENKANQPFDPPIETLKVTDVLTITRNEASYGSLAMAPYKNTVNKQPFFGYAVGEARIDSISATTEYDPEFGAYWTVTYVIHFRQTASWVPSENGIVLLGGPMEPWDETRRNIGTRYVKTGGSTKQAARDGAGYQFTDPIDLDADGTKLPDGDMPLYICFKPFPKKSWSPLRLEP